MPEVTECLPARPALDTSSAVVKTRIEVWQMIGAQMDNLTQTEESGVDGRA